MTQPIYHKNQCLAIFIPKEMGNVGTHFITQDSDPLQVGIISRTTGETIPAHRHLPVHITYEGIKHEFIYVKQGCVTVTIYSDAGETVHTQTLRSGEAFLQLLGGHGFYFEEPTQLIEVKQGPYSGQQKDKAFYEHTR